MSDPLSIAAIVIAVGGIVVNCIKSAHIQKCKSLCCWSDCSEPSPPPIKQRKKNLVIMTECPPTPPSPDTPEEEEAPATVGTPPKISSA